ncbi:MAG: hypothetical protein HC817_04600 [Saprospiraceae bacterium]|nr:hypothetical protein [Saprospiraceae bacterium]
MRFLSVLSILFLTNLSISAQTTTPTTPSSPTTPTSAPVVQPDAKVSSYIGIVHPLVTFQGGKKPAINFDGFYQVGVSTAVIVKRSPKFAYNFEIIPFVRRQNGTARLANVLFHPGVTFFLKNNYSFTSRIGLETNGRFGFSTVFGKTVWKGKFNNFSVVVPILFRFGSTTNPLVNDKASATLALNLTYGF